MAKDDFFESVRAAVRRLGPAAEADRPYSDPDGLARALRRSGRWLTPKAVEGFDARDFADLPPEQRDELGRAVGQFAAVAAGVPDDAPAGDAQVEAALPHFRRVVEVVQRLVRDEWVAAVEALSRQVESWAAERDWAVKRDAKTVAESFLGAYEVPRLLIHSTEGRLLLDPVARYAVGTDGLVDLCVLPSYDAAILTRRAGGWYVRPPQANGRPRPWSKEVFFDTARRLVRAA